MNSFVQPNTVQDGKMLHLRPGGSEMPRLRNATAAGDVFTIRLPRDLVESLRVIAEENGLSVHNYIRMILTKHVKEYQSTNDLTLKIKKS